VRNSLRTVPPLNPVRRPCPNQMYSGLLLRPSILFVSIDISHCPPFDFLFDECCKRVLGLLILCRISSVYSRMSYLFLLDPFFPQWQSARLSSLPVIFCLQCMTRSFMAKEFSGAGSRSGCITGPRAICPV